jgi:hypothetical protein
LSEVIALATDNKIRQSIKLFKVDQINENLDLSERATLLAEP